MIPAAAPSDTRPLVALWNPARGAYLCASGSYSRRLSMALRVTHRQAACLKGKWDEPLRIEPLSLAPAELPNENEPRVGLADLAGTELLRRAVRGLCARDRTQAPQWCVVMDALGLTSGAAVMLCRRLTIDPNKRTGQ